MHTKEFLTIIGTLESFIFEAENEERKKAATEIKGEIKKAISRLFELSGGKYGIKENETDLTKMSQSAISNHIISVTAKYTGKNVYSYYGELSGGYFFKTSDNMNNVSVMTKNPLNEDFLNDFEESIFINVFTVAELPGVECLKLKKQILTEFRNDLTKMTEAERIARLKRVNAKIENL